jgi:diguanylate cyclase (GGDEF)-like protein
VARRITDVVRPGDDVVRLGGDEFVVALHGMAAHAVGEIADRLVEAISWPIEVPVAGRVTIAASVGLATGDADLDRLVLAADAALYRAKRTGGGRVQAG